MRADHLRAVIYVAAYLIGRVEARQWLDLCVAYCQRKTYEVAEIVMDVQGGQAWDDVLKVVHAGRNGAVAGWRADVIVIPDRSHLPPGRIPRVEAVVEEQGWTERPRFLRH